MTTKVKKQKSSEQKVKPVTVVALLLDQSSSMESLRDKAVEFYNEHVQQAKINSKDQDVRCCLVTFNGQVFEHLWDVAANDLKESTHEDYTCEGATALNDAIGYTVTKLLETTPHNDENVSYLIQIITDGQENASAHYPRGSDKLKGLISRVQETKRWTFTFMGCDPEYLEVLSRHTAVPTANMAAFTPSTADLANVANKVALRGFYTKRASGPGGQSCGNFYNFGDAAKVGSANLMDRASEDVCRVMSMDAQDSGPKLKVEKTNVFTSKMPVKYTTE